MENKGNKSEVGIEIEKEEERGKVFWYEFIDKLNQGSYEIGFHMDGDLIGYSSYGNTKEHVLHEVVPTESGYSFNWEDLKMLGRFERVIVPDEEPPIVGRDIISDDKDVPSKG